MLIFKYIILLLITFQISIASKQTDLDIKCSKGDMYSCHKLGRKFRKVKAYEKAIYYFKIVCDNNISDGCTSLATYYHLKNRKYNKKAFKYYTKACELNNPFACNNLGTFYDDGNAIDKNASKAISLFEKAYCLGSIEKSYNNRQKTIQDNKLQNHIKDEIDCLKLHIDESMSTAYKVDDESSYQ